MKPQTLLSRYLSILLASFIAGGFLLPRYYEIPYPKPPGSQNQLAPQIQKGGINAISENKPDIVLIGDSVLYTGIEDSLFSAALGLKAYSIAVPGSGSAVWYLIFKNVVLAAKHHPKYVVVPFRDTLLTVPSFRTTGHYFSVVDEYAGKNEPLLLERAYLNSINPLEKIVDGYFPPYSARWQLREGINRRARYAPASIFLNCDQSCADAAFAAIFDKEGMNNLVFNNRASYDAGILYARASLDFSRVDQSFLPAMIQLAQENDVTLVFVRMKNLDYPVAESETPALRNYIRALEDYLAAQKNVRFLDLSHAAEIRAEYFEADGFHFNAEGKIAFSKILAEQLQSILELK
jgi:hypothetical protein